MKYKLETELETFKRKLQEKYNEAENMRKYHKERYGYNEHNPCSNYDHWETRARTLDEVLRMIQGVV